jgi:O-antigen ligase
MSIAAALGLMFLEKTRRKQVVAALLALVLMFTLVQNNTLGAYIAILASCVLIPLLLVAINKRFSVHYLLPLVMLLVITPISSPTFFQSNFGQLAQDSENLAKVYVFDTADEDTLKAAGKAGTGRWSLWVSAAEAIAEKPVFGYGPEGLAQIYEEQKLGVDRPHNEVLQYAAFMGVPGLLFYLCALVLLFVRFWKQKRQCDVVCVIGVFVVITYFVSSLFGNTMFYTTPYYYMFLGLIAGTPEIARHDA